MLIRTALILSNLLFLLQIVQCENTTDFLPANDTLEIDTDNSTDEIRYEDLGRRWRPAPKACSCLRWTDWGSHGQPKTLDGHYLESPAYLKDASKAKSDRYGPYNYENVCETPVSVGCRILVPHTYDEDDYSKYYSACPKFTYRRAPEDGLLQLRYLCPDYHCPCLQWSDWYDYDDPDDEGDVETLLGTIPKQKWPCVGGERPLDVDCRTVSGKRIHQTKNKGVTCDLNGLKCYNGDQGPRCTCEDYKVRFLCFRVRSDHGEIAGYHAGYRPTTYRPRPPRPSRTEEDGYEDEDKILLEDVLIPVYEETYDHGDRYEPPKPDPHYKPKQKPPKPPQHYAKPDEYEHHVDYREKKPHYKPPSVHYPEETIYEEYVPPPEEDAGYEDEVSYPKRIDPEVIPGGDGIVERGPYDDPPPEGGDYIEPMYYRQYHGSGRPDDHYHPGRYCSEHRPGSRPKPKYKPGKKIDGDREHKPHGQVEDVDAGVLDGKGKISRETDGRPIDGGHYSQGHRPQYSTREDHKHPHRKSTLIGADVDAITGKDRPRKPTGQVVDADAKIVDEHAVKGLLGGRHKPGHEYDSGHGKYPARGVDKYDGPRESHREHPNPPHEYNSRNEEYPEQVLPAYGHHPREPHRPKPLKPKGPLVGADVHAIAGKGESKRPHGELVDADVDALAEGGGPVGGLLGPKRKPQYRKPKYDLGHNEGARPPTDYQYSPDRNPDAMHKPEVVQHSGTATKEVMRKDAAKTLVGADVDTVAGNGGSKRPQGEVVDVDALAAGGGPGYGGNGSYYAPHEDRKQKDNVSQPEDHPPEVPPLPETPLTDQVLTKDNASTLVEDVKLPQDNGTLVGSDLGAITGIENSKIPEGEVVDTDAVPLTGSEHDGGPLAGILHASEKDESDESEESELVAPVPSVNDSHPAESAAGLVGLEDDSKKLPDQGAPIPEVPVPKDKGVAADVLPLTTREETGDFGSIADLKVSPISGPDGKPKESPVAPIAGVLGRSGVLPEDSLREEPMARMKMPTDQSRQDCNMKKLIYTIFAVKPSARGTDHLHKLQTHDC